MSLKCINLTSLGRKELPNQVSHESGTGRRELPVLRQDKIRFEEASKRGFLPFQHKSSAEHHILNILEHGREKQEMMPFFT